MFDIKSFYEAKDVADAINALVKNPDAEIISGGTDVLIRVREGKDAGRSVVSIHNIEALKGVRLLDDGDLWIGAGTAFSHITNDALIQKYIPMLGDAVVQVIADGSFGLFNPAEVEIQERIGLLAVKGKSRKHQNDRKAGLFGCLNDTFCQGEVHGGIAHSDDSHPVP